MELLHQDTDKTVTVSTAIVAVSFFHCPTDSGLPNEPHQREELQRATPCGGCGFGLFQRKRNPETYPCTPFLLGGFPHRGRYGD